MADKDIIIGIKTTADTSGADEAVDAIDKLPDAVKPAVDAIDKTVDAVDDAKKEVEALKKELEDAKDSTSDAAEALEGVGAAAEKAGTKAKKSGETVSKSIFEIEDAAKKAAREMDVLEAKRRKLDGESTTDKTGGLLGVDVSGGAKKLGQEAADYAGFGQEFQAVSSLISADAVMVAGSFVAIGAAAAKSYDLLAETATRWREFENELKARGEALPQDIADQIATIEATISPVKSVITSVTGAISEMWKTVKDPVGELTGLNDLKESMALAAQKTKELNDQRLKIANGEAGKIKGIYDDEVASLREQEATLRRIAGVRSELGALANQGARQEVDSARLRGGDVQLAEYNALATQLQTGLAALGDKLRASQASAATAQTEFNAASTAYQEAINKGLDKLDPKQFTALDKALETARTALDRADETVTDQQQVFATGKETLLRGIENELAKLDTAAKGALSAEATKAGDAVYQSIKDQFATGPTAAIEQIKVEVGAITTAATEQQAQVQASLATERAGTVQAIQQLAPTPQDTQAITAAVQEVAKAMTSQGNATITALGVLTTAVGQVTARLQNQQQQINQIFSRIR